MEQQVADQEEPGGERVSSGVRPAWATLFCRLLDCCLTSLCLSFPIWKMEGGEFPSHRTVFIVK